jgi:predicted ATPase
MESAIKRPRDLNQPFSLVYALLFATMIHALRGEALEAGRLCEHIEALAEQGGFAGFLVLNRLYQGWVASVHGEHDRGIATIRSSMADFPPLGFTSTSSILAESYVRAGRYEEALDAAVAGREHAERTGEHFAESEIERVAGDALMRMGAANAPEAEQCMRRAVAIVAQQGAKSCELRATMSLARLRQLRSERREGAARRTEGLTPMPKRNEKTAPESLSRQRSGTPRTPKIEIDFESLVAAGVAAVVIKPAEKRRRPWPNPKP